VREVPAPVAPAAGPQRYTAADLYRTLTSVLMVVMGIVILARTLPLGVHLQALLVGLGFLGLGAYRLSFVIAYLRRRRTR
jgi:hypothetical protein